MHVATPAFRYEVNLNTIILGATLIATGVGWGVSYNALVNGRDTNAANIQRLETRLSALETTGRVLDNHELRITRVESQAAETGTVLRSVESKLAKFETDIAVIRQILEGQPPAAR